MLIWVKKHHTSEKDYLCNPSACICKNGKYLASVMDDSVIPCDEVIESYNEKKQKLFQQNFYILLAFLLITITLFTAVSIYCYLIKKSIKTKTQSQNNSVLVV